MTADEVFDQVLGLMFSTDEDKSDYELMFYPILNLVLAECFEKNNVLRRKRGAEIFSEIPMIQESDEEVPYESEMLRKIIPYGIAANLYAEDDENGITNIYRERYFTLLEEIGFAEFTETEDSL